MSSYTLQRNKVTDQLLGKFILIKLPYSQPARLLNGHPTSVFFQQFFLSIAEKCK